MGEAREGHIYSHTHTYTHTSLCCCDPSAGNQGVSRKALNPDPRDRGAETERETRRERRNSTHRTSSTDERGITLDGSNMMVQVGGVGGEGREGLEGWEGRRSGGTAHTGLHRRTDPPLSPALSPTHILILSHTHLLSPALPPSPLRPLEGPCGPSGAEGIRSTGTAVSLSLSFTPILSHPLSLTHTSPCPPQASGGSMRAFGRGGDPEYRHSGMGGIPMRRLPSGDMMGGGGRSGSA